MFCALRYVNVKCGYFVRCPSLSKTSVMAAIASCSGHLFYAFRVDHVIDGLISFVAGDQSRLYTLNIFISVPDHISGLHTQTSYTIQPLNHDMIDGYICVHRSSMCFT